MDAAGRPGYVRTPPRPDVAAVVGLHRPGQIRGGGPNTPPPGWPHPSIAGRPGASRPRVYVRAPSAASSGTPAAVHAAPARGRAGPNASGPRERGSARVGAAETPAMPGRTGARRPPRRPRRTIAPGPVSDPAWTATIRARDRAHRGLVPALIAPRPGCRIHGHRRRVHGDRARGRDRLVRAHAVGDRGRADRDACDTGRFENRPLRRPRRGSPGHARSRLDAGHETEPWYPRSTSPGPDGVRDGASAAPVGVPPPGA